MLTDFPSTLTWNGITYNSLNIWGIFTNHVDEVWTCSLLWVLPKFQGHRRWFRLWIVMKGEKFSTSITWVGKYNHSHLSYPWIDLIKVRVQTSMDRSLLARSKLTNVLSHPSQSYFLPNPSPDTKIAQISLRGELFTTYLTNHCSYRGQTKVTDTSKRALSNFY